MEVGDLKSAWELRKSKSEGRGATERRRREGVEGRRTNAPAE